MTAKVRSAVPADLSFIFHANQEMARETEGKELEAATLQRGVETCLGDPNRGFYLLAELGGEQAGTLMVTREWSDWRNGWFWWIQSVYVLPRFRGHKVYSAMHREVVRRANSETGVCGIRLYVEVENAHATKVYEALGMNQARYNMMEQMT